MMVAAVGWPDVVIALIAACAGIAPTVLGLLIRKDVHTKNGHTLAETVEHAHEKTVETNRIVRELNGELTGDTKDAAAGG